MYNSSRWHLQKVVNLEYYTAWIIINWRKQSRQNTMWNYKWFSLTNCFVLDHALPTSSWGLVYMTSREFSHQIIVRLFRQGHEHFVVTRSSWVQQTDKISSHFNHVIEMDIVNIGLVYNHQSRVNFPVVPFRKLITFKSAIIFWIFFEKWIHFLYEISYIMVNTTIVENRLIVTHYHTKSEILREQALSFSCQLGFTIAV